jgi:hypothetical protein
MWLFIVFGTVEEWSLHVVIILIEVEVESEKINHNFGLLQSSSIVECPLFEIVFMSDITSYFVKTIDQTESFVLVLYVDQFIKQALASLIVYVSEIGWSRVIFDYL